MNKRGYILLEGLDRHSFLNGLMTNDATKLSTGIVLFTAFLNAQGRFLFDGFMAEKKEQLVLDIEYGARDALFTHLSKYKLRSKVQITKVEVSPFDFPWPQPFSKAFTNKERILKALPLGSIDVIPEKGFILECGYEELHGIDWTKGCYLGQELVAKTKYRGELRKKILPLTFDGELSFGAGILTEKGQEAGEIRSVEPGCALAMVRLEFKDEPLFVGTTRVELFYCSLTHR